MASELPIKPVTSAPPNQEFFGDVPSDGGFAVGGGEGTDVHLRDYIDVVLRRVHVAASVFVSILLLAFAYVLTRTPRFTAGARILVSAEIDYTGIAGATDAQVAPSGMREVLQTQVELIKSRPVVAAAFDKASLASAPGFRDARDPIGQLTKQVEVVPRRGTYLIDVAVEREDAQQAARIVNALVDAFMGENRKRRLGVSEEGLAELRGKADELRSKLDAADRDLQAFMVTNNIVSFEKAQNVVLETLMGLNTELTRKEPLRMTLQAKVEAAREALSKGLPVDTLPDVMNSELVRSLRLDLARMENEYSQMQERLGANHPQLVAMTTQIGSLRTKLALEASSILRSLETEYLQAQKEEDLLRQRLKAQEGEVFHLNELTAQYSVLRQTKDSVAQTFQTIMRRIEEIDINRMGAQGETIFVISKASPPTEPSWPEKPKMLAIAALLAVLLSVGLCFFLDYMDTAVKDEADVKHSMRTEVLTGIPAIDIPTKAADDVPAELVVHSDPRGMVAEAFRSLRTTLSFAMPGESLRSLVVSSTAPSEGKSLVAANLAAVEAKVGRRTLLVDSDMRKPRLHSLFGHRLAPGLSNLLVDAKLRPEDAIVPTRVDNLFLLPAGVLPPNPVELLDSKRFGEVFAKITAQFDFVVIDSPPGMTMTDALILARHADGILVVVRGARTAKDMARRFAERIRSLNLRLLGVVLNNVDQPKTGRRYGYYYYDRYHRYYAPQDQGESSRAREKKS